MGAGERRQDEGREGRRRGKAGGGGRGRQEEEGGGGRRGNYKGRIVRKQEEI